MKLKLHFLFQSPIYQKEAIIMFYIKIQTSYMLKNMKSLLQYVCDKGYNLWTNWWKCSTLSSRRNSYKCEEDALPRFIFVWRPSSYEVSLLIVRILSKKKFRIRKDLNNHVTPVCLPNGERPPPNETCYTVGYGAVTSFLFTMSKAIMLDWKDINSNLSDYFSKYFKPMTRSGQGKGDSGAPVLCQVWKSTFFLNDTLFGDLKISW